MSGDEAEELTVDWNRDQHLAALNAIFPIGLCGTTLLVSWLWAWRRRHLQPLRSRSTVLLAAQCVACTTIFTEGILRHALDGKSVCEANLFLQYINLSALLAPSAMSGYRVTILRRLQSMIAQGFEHVDLATVHRLKRHASPGVQVAVMAIMGVICAVLAAIRITVVRPNYYFQPDGPIIVPSRTENLLLLCFLLVQLVVYISVACKLRRLSDDLFFQRREMMIQASFLGVFMVLFLGLFSAGSGFGRELSLRYLPSSVLASLISAGVSITSVLVPTILTYDASLQNADPADRVFSHSSDAEKTSISGRSRVLSGHDGSVSLSRDVEAGHDRGSEQQRRRSAVSSAFDGSGSDDERAARSGPQLRRVLTAVSEEERGGRKIPLKVILAWPPSRKLFAEHLEKEFAAESLSFWRTAEPPRVAARATALGISVFELYRALAEMFLLPGSAMEVNVPSDVSKEAVRLFGEHKSGRAQSVSVRPITTEDAVTDTEVASARRLFRKARNHMYLLMKTDSWPRFRQSPAFEKLLQITRTLSAELADGAVGADVSDDSQHDRDDRPDTE